MLLGHRRRHVDADGNGADVPVLRFAAGGDDDEFLVFDIMKPPGNLTRSELNRKLVIVAKKQKDNLLKLIRFIGTDYPVLKQRRILLIDDEADLASVRFVRKRGSNDIEQGKIANLIVSDGDPLEIRTKIKHLFINGHEIPLTSRHTELYEKYKARP